MFLLFFLFFEFFWVFREDSISFSRELNLDLYNLLFDLIEGGFLYFKRDEGLFEEFLKNELCLFFI